jgi:hypothetical protein
VKYVKLLSATLAAIGLFSLSTLSVQAKPEFSKTEKKPCTACHVSNKSKELNDTGKYYKEHKKLPAAEKK